MDKKLVLIVEDELPIVKVLTDKLTHEGFEVASAPDGKEGLEAAFRYRPDIILLDIVMPIMDGVTMLKKLRDDSWGKEVEVIILTNLTDPGKNAEAINEGVRDYLIKTDWNLNEVVEKVKKKTRVQ